MSNSKVEFNYSTIQLLNSYIVEVSTILLFYYSTIVLFHYSTIRSIEVVGKTPQG